MESGLLGGIPAGGTASQVGLGEAVPALVSSPQLGRESCQGFSGSATSSHPSTLPPECGGAATSCRALCFAQSTLGTLGSVSCCHLEFPEGP